MRVSTWPFTSHAAQLNSYQTWIQPPISDFLCWHSRRIPFAVVLHFSSQPHRAWSLAQLQHCVRSTKVILGAKVPHFSLVRSHAWPCPGTCLFLWVEGLQKLAIFIVSFSLSLLAHSEFTIVLAWWEEHWMLLRMLLFLTVVVSGNPWLLLNSNSRLLWILLLRSRSLAL